MLLRGCFFGLDFYRFALLLPHQFCCFLCLEYPNKLRTILNCCLVIHFFRVEVVWAFIFIAFEALADSEEGVWLEISRTGQIMQPLPDLSEVEVVVKVPPSVLTDFAV